MRDHIDTRDSRMSLFKYFKKINDDVVDSQTQSSSPLPDPDGPLSSKIPSCSIISANDEVKPLMSSGRATHERGTYDRFTLEEKAIIARRGIENGVTRTIRQYNKNLQGRKLRESTVRTWITQYKKQLAMRKALGDEDLLAALIGQLEQKRRGRPLLLGEQLDRYTREYIAELRRNGGIINAQIVSSAALGIVKNFDANLLQSNGGHISCSQEWAKGLLK